MYVFQGSMSYSISVNQFAELHLFQACDPKSHMDDRMDENSIKKTKSLVKASVGMSDG